MKNITVTIDDALYRKARIKAAELDKSLTAVVRDYLISFAGQETEYERRKKLQSEVLKTIRSFKAGNRLSRKGAHDRDALR